jgi:UDP-glucose:tetrahydrobiopterin glucosyltransferase
MRLAFVAPLVSPIAPPYLGGAQALLAALAAGMAERGHTVTLYAASGSRIDAPGVTVRDLGIDSGQLRPAQFFGKSDNDGEAEAADAIFFRSAQGFLRVFTQLQQELDDYDLIHAHAFDWPAFAFGALLAEQRTVLHTLHLPAVNPSINLLLGDLRATNNPTRLLTVSRACAATYAPYAAMDAIIYNGIDVDAIPSGAQPDPENFLLFAGRISPEKGVTDALEIARRAGRRLLLAGGIYDQSYFDQQVRPALEAGKGFSEYLGQVSQGDLWRLMSRASALLLPIGWEEPFGLVAAEALAAGCPVIAYARGALPEIISGGETGFLIPPGDVDAAASAVSQIAAISRAACRARAKDRFSLSRMLDEHERLYSTMVTTHPSR